MLNQQNLLERALHTAKIGLWTYHIDSDSIELSDNAQEIFSVVKNRVNDLSELLLYFASDDDRQRYRTWLNQIRNENVSQSGIYQINSSDNNSKWVRCIAQPEIENGVCKAVFGTVQDITSHIETEHKLAETERKYEMMAKNTSDGIIIIEKEKTTFASPGFLKLMRYNTFEDYIKATKGSLRPVIHSGDKARIKAEFRRKMEDNAETGTFQFRVLTGDGKYIWREDHVNYQYDCSGNLEKTYAVCRNISDRKKTEKKLEKLVEEKNWLVSTIVHDIRNPISAGVSLNSILLDEINNKEHRYLIRAANEKLESALELAAELLEISSLDDNCYKLDKEFQDPAILLAGIENSFKASAENYNIDLIVNTAVNLPEISFNYDKMRRVLNNLVSNALKFTEKGGTVRIAAENMKHNLVISVSDSGIGVPENQIDNLFEKFTEARRTGLRGEAPTGLGLSISKQIIELHGGSITVESKEGEGTTFFVHLPK